MATSRQVANAIELSGAHCQQQGRGFVAFTNRAGAAYGRPLGLLLAWLEFGEGCGSKVEHKDIDLVKLFCSADYQETRSRLRTQFSTLLGAADFLEQERDAAPGEGEELAAIAMRFGG